MSTKKMAATFEDHARLYIRKGWWVVPLWHSTTEGCECGDPLCEVPGQHPTRSVVSDASETEEAAASWSPGFDIPNLGIVTGSASGIVAIASPVAVIAEESLGKLLAEYDVSIKTTEIISTVARALLYKMPPGYPVLPESSTFPGIGSARIIGEGGFVVAPPSSDAFTGECYRWSRIDSMVTISAKLLDFVMGISQALHHIPLLKTKIPLPTATGYLRRFYRNLVASGVDPNDARDLTRRKAGGLTPPQPPEELDRILKEEALVPAKGGEE
jgi:hypothetical protein